MKISYILPFSLLTFIFSLLLAFCQTADAAGASALSGRVMNADGKAVAGARVFAYDSPVVRRPADFLSAPSDAKGGYRIVLPPGRYWVVARLKKVDGFGPLLAGDLHSGEPMEIEVAADRDTSADFTVLDIKDARKLQSRERENLVRISGRIIDAKGAPVAHAYAAVTSPARTSGMPDFVSAWTDRDGRYTLAVPPGKYLLGSEVRFPPDAVDYLPAPIVLDTSRTDLDIVRKK